MNRWKRIIVLLIVVKLSIFFVIFAAFFLLPTQKTMREGNFLDDDYKKLTFASAFMTWDSQHYLFLSDHGYRAYQESNRFYPLFPGLIHVASLPFHNSFWGGIVVVNVISIFLAILFFAFVKKYFSEEIAWNATVLFLAFPTAFYLSLIYSEGLFLFLAICFFWFLYKREFFIAGLFSVFLPLTRPVGIFITVPFAVYLLQYIHERVKSKKFSQKDLLRLLHVLWPFVGFGLLLLFYRLKTGYAYEPFLIDRMVVGQWSVWNIFNPMIFLKAFFAFPLVIHGITNSAIDRAFFILYLCGLPLVFKKTSKSLFAYYAMMGGVAFFGNFLSYTRYLFVAFPIFIAVGSLLANKKYVFFFFPVLFILLMLQALFIILHSLNYWVA